VRTARAAVVTFAFLAVLVALQIETIEQAWRWVAALGAALGPPTALRWLWWRMTPRAEISAAIAGLAVAAVLLAQGTLAYEVQLIAISASSVLGMALGIASGPPVEPAVVSRFVQRVDPLGLWPGRTPVAGSMQLLRTVSVVLTVVVVTTLGIAGIKTLLFG
jgi:Na+/proline symporter